MRISIVQINPRVGDFIYNQEKIRIAIHKAINDNANVLILPFGAISGFPQGNLMVFDNFRNQIISVLQELAPETLNTNLSIFSEGREIIAQGVIQFEALSKDLQEQKTISLPNIFNSKEFDIFINLGPKVFEKNRPEAHEIDLRILASEKKVWVFDINLAGATDDLIFTGLSSIVNPQGELVTRLKFAEEDFITVDLEHLEEYSITTIPAGEEILYLAIIQGIRDYYQKNHFKKILVSISGGIDSALVLTLAVEAIGANNVHAIYLPSKFSSIISLEEAQQLCINLNVPLRIFSIESLHNIYNQQLDFLQNGNPLWEENIQARIRGNIVMSISNSEGSLVLATGNKSEAAMGYCTLYGDTCGGLAPISDLLKTEVCALCRYINDKYSKEIIPERTITRPPSAELKANQEDEHTLPNYDFLDQVLFLHCEEGLDSNEIITRLGRSEDILQIFTLLYKSAYKRLQTPMGLKLSKRYFRLDWQIPTTVGLWFKNKS